MCLWQCLLFIRNSYIKSYSWDMAYGLLATHWVKSPISPLSKASKALVQSSSEVGCKTLCWALCAFLLEDPVRVWEWLWEKWMLKTVGPAEHSCISLPPHLQKKLYSALKATRPLNGLEILPSSSDTKGFQVGVERTNNDMGRSHTLCPR